MYIHIDVYIYIYKASAHVHWVSRERLNRYRASCQILTHDAGAKLSASVRKRGSVLSSAAAPSLQNFLKKLGEPQHTYAYTSVEGEKAPPNAAA